jgi:diguanylate cyclase (GGDEF)-like protein
MSTTPSDPEEAALQIYRECRRAFSPGYFHLEILSGELEGTSFVAGSQEEFHQGLPRPPAYPPKRPGVHRRAEWQVLHSILEVKSRSLARIQLWCDPRKLGRDATELFESLVPHMADALNFALLGRDASRDALTGLALRRELESRLHSAFTRRRRSDRAQSVLIVDLDRFKSVNDTWGHAAGDRVLVAVAEAIKQELREADLAARFGGEEFALFLEGSHGRAALEIADRIRQKIESLTLEWEGQTFSVTASVGAASIPELYVHTGHDLLALADEALYHAKRQGRNRCFLYQGKNRCLDPQGREHTFGDVPAAEAPRIFA